MREILFRAKAINRGPNREYRTNYKNGDWVYGLITKLYNDIYKDILPAEMRNTDEVSGIEVDYKTIGEYTGLKDKNGERIFEGDIVTYADAVADFEGYHDDVFLNCGEVGISAWDGIYFTNRQTVDMSDLYESETMVDCEVIGNIFDNPELLKG